MKNILITGGTGSFGKAFIKRMIAQHPKVERLVVYSRDELKQYELQQELGQDSRLRFFIGDVRDYRRLRRAIEGIDTVIHAAALKQVPAAEYNPFEFIKTNVLGAQNLIEACWENKVDKVIALSTDKAAAPINLYGATKLCADKLFTAANGSGGTRNTKFSIVRYGNVMGSRGSVIPLFLKLKHTGSLPITDAKMTRFNISLNEGVDLVLTVLKNLEGGEIFIPKIPSYNILDIATAIAPECTHNIVGRRPGEKLHEEMITLSDSASTVDLGKLYAILPFSDINKIKDYCVRNNGEPVKENFSYNSGDNDAFLSVSDIHDLLKKSDVI